MASPGSYCRIGVVWGTIAFFLGYFSAFAAPLGKDNEEVIGSLVGLIFGFLIILPITLAAIWIPKISAGLLMLSFFMFECLVVSDVGLSGVLPVALRLGLPTIGLACGYMYVAYVRVRPHRVPEGQREAADGG